MALEAAKRIQEFLSSQLQAWDGIRSRETLSGQDLPVITLSMEPGSGGTKIAIDIADRLGFDHFHRELLEVVASHARVSSKVIEKIEKERLSGIQDFISQMIDTQYLHTDVYQEHLTKIVQTIGRRGYGVIVGRGANFILSPDTRLAVRIVAPLGQRVERVCKQFNVLPEEAEERIRNREEKRAAFIKKAFKQDIRRTMHYDLVINTGILTHDAAARLICGAWFLKFFE